MRAQLTGIGKVAAGFILNAIGVAFVALFQDAWQYLSMVLVTRDFFLNAHFNFSPWIYQNVFRWLVGAVGVQILAGLALSGMGLPLRQAFPAASRVFAPLRLGGLAILTLFQWPWLDMTALMKAAGLLMCLTVLFRIISLMRSAEILPRIKRAIRSWNPSPARAGWLVFGLVILLHLPVWMQVSLRKVDGQRDRLFRNGGDQAAYLAITESVVRDGDLDVSNNVFPEGVSHRPLTAETAHAGGAQFHNPDLYKNKDQAACEEAERRFDGRQWSNHRPGTAFLIAPFYMLGDWIGGWQRPWIGLFLILLTAAAIREVVLLACLVGMPSSLVLILGLCGGISLPVVCLSQSIYPETIMFFIMARLMRRVALNRDRGWDTFEIGLLCAYTPWLQDKYALWVAPLFLARLFLQRRRLLAQWPLLIAPAVSAAFVIRNNLFMYRQILPKNNYGEFVPLLEALLSGLPGSWLDWGYGLMMLAPGLLLVPMGFLAALRERAATPGVRATLWASLASLGIGWLVIGFWWAWYGMACPPNRFMHSLFPVCLLAAMLASRPLYEKSPNLVIVLWFLTIIFGLEALNPRHWYSYQHPAAQLSQFLSWDALAVRYHQRIRWYLHYDVARGLVIILMALAMEIALAARLLNRGVRAPALQRRLAWGGLTVFLALLTVFPQGPAQGLFSLDRGDILTRAGVFKRLSCVPTGAKAMRLEGDLIFFDAADPSVLALAIHVCDASGRILGQHDLDIETYLRETLAQSSERRKRFFEQRAMTWQADLAWPEDADHVYVGLYAPARSARPLSILRHSFNVVHPRRDSP